MYSDELMEMLLAEEEVSEELIHDVVRDAVHRAGIDAGLHGHGLSQQGRAAAAGRDRRAICRRRSSAESTAKNPTNPEQKIPARARSDQAVRRHGVQDRRRSVRPADVHAHLPGHDRKGRARTTTSAPARRSASAASCGCTPTSARKSTRPRPATSWPSWASTARAATPTAASRSTARSKTCSSPSRSSRWRSTRCRATTRDRLGKALQRFRKEDPTFRVMTDEETGETVIAGMGELHLEIYVERIRREYKVEVEVGAPKVSYREAPTKAAEYDFKHKKQTGGSGQYAHIVGTMGPMTDEEVDRDRRRAAVRRQDSRRPHSGELHPGGRKGLPRHARQGPGRRVPGRRRQDRPERRLVSRSRQLGHGVPWSAPRTASARRS